MQNMERLHHVMSMPPSLAKSHGVPALPSIHPAVARSTPTLCLLQEMEADSEERAPAGLVPAAAMGGVGGAAVNPPLAAAAASGAAGQAAGEASGGRGGD